MARITKKNPKTDKKMAPKSSSSSKKRPPDPNGIFQGMSVFLLPKSIQSRRLQVFKQKLEQMGATVEDHLSKKVTHVFATNSDALVKQLTNNELLKQFKGNVLLYEWLENCLKSGERLSEEKYLLNVDLEKVDDPGEVRDSHHEPSNAENSDDNSGSGKNEKVDDEELKSSIHNKESSIHSDDKESYVEESDHHAPEASVNDASQSSSLYKPPDLNRNITEIFGKLIDIYRALGDDRRSFSYYKAIPVIEKLPFKIDSIDQVKHLPAIGKSMQDHIHEIVTTGRLSKLDYFEKDEKVRSVCLFGEVWGIGPATALKLYEKGHRTLDDLKNEESLTTSQKLGLKYFEDIKRRIPRNEVADMEMLLQKAGQDILPAVIIVCGGSYRRGKATCGDMDIIITHPDGESHKGFLPKYVKYLKDISFLREDLIFSIHSTEGTDSGVDTYFGLCTYPGRELRHRIDLKVYPRSIYAFGLLAWTGNDVLNRRLRLLAESKGYRLDDTGLFLSTQSSSSKRGMRASTSINCKTEKDVFDVLGFPWLEPHERNL